MKTKHILLTLLAALMSGALVGQSAAQITVGGDGPNTTDLTSYSGAQSLTKIGSNTVTLGVRSFYSDPTFVEAGNLVVVASGANFVPNNPNTSYVVSDGATLTMGSGSTWAALWNRPVTLNGGTLVSANQNNADSLGPLTMAGGRVTGNSYRVYDGNTWNLSGTNSIETALGFLNFSAPTGLTLNVTDGTTTLSGQMFGFSGAAQFVQKTGSGTAVLTANNGYGETRIQEGALQLGNGGTTGSLGSGAVSNNASLVFDRSNEYRVDNLISGTGTVTQQGTGATRFNANNTYSGGLVVTGGSAFGLTERAFGTGGVTLESGSLLITRESNMTVSNAITVTADGTGDAGIAGSSTGSVMAFSGDITLGRDVNVAAFNTVSRTDFTGSMSGAGGVTITGGRVLFTTTGKTYTGGTTVNAGTILQLSGAEMLPDAQDVTVNGTLHLASEGGTETIGGLSGAGRVEALLGGSYELVVGNADTANFAGTIANNAGVVSLTKAGSGTQVLSGGNIYTGATTISEGTLQVGDGGTTGSLGSGNVTNNATLAFNRSDNPTVANAISGSGAVVQAGSGTTTFSGAHTHTGGTFVEAGTLALSGGSGSQGSTAAGPYTIGDGGTLRVTASTFWFNGTPSFNFTADGGGTIDTSSGVNFVMGGNPNFTSAGGARNDIIGSSGINIGSRTATLDVARGTDATSDLHITSNFWNNGSIVKTGDGIATLAGNNSYSGTTTISEGTLQVGDGGTTGNLGNSTSIINNAALVFNRSDSVTQGNPISGTGSVTKIGAGTVTLSGNNSYTGLTTVNEGTLQLGAGGGTYVNNASDFAINNGSTLAFGGGRYDLNNQSTGGQRTITFGAEGGNTLDTKTVTVADWKGSTYQSQGGSRNAILGLGLNINAGVVATFDVARGTDPDVDLAVSQVWNSGSIVKNGDGIMTLASAAYTGSTTVNAGILSIAGGSDSQGSTGAGPYTIGDGATLRVTAEQFWFNGTPSFNFTTNGGGTIDTASDVNFVMGGNATFTSAGGARNEIAGSSGINLNLRTATLDVARGSDAETDLLVSSAFSNTGSLTKTGDGIATLTGSNTYTGTTTISAGTLQIGNGGTSGNLGTGNVVNNAALAFNRSDSHSVSNAISGTGSLAKNGTGTVTLTGTNTYTGGTAVNAGELNVNGSIAGSAVTVSSGASLSGSGTVGAISGAGEINPGNSPGILTAPSVDGSGGLAFNFEFTSLNPTYSNASASLNDVLRLTDATPFVASLAAANTVNIYFNVDVFEEGQLYTGGFYTDTQADFLSQIVDASFNYYVQDAGGSVSYGGQSYSALGEGLAVELTTINQSADFAGGTIDGQVVQFEVVPEPSTYALLVLGAAALGAHAWRKRRRAQGL